MEEIILKNRYLAGDDKEINKAVDELMLHISGYKMVFSRWNVGDYSQMSSYNNFPAHLEPLIDKKIKELKKELK